MRNTNIGTQSVHDLCGFFFRLPRLFIKAQFYPRWIMSNYREKHIDLLTSREKTKERTMTCRTSNRQAVGV